MQAMGENPAHQHVVTRVELDLVDALALAVVAVQHRRVQVGQPRVGLHLGLANLIAQGSQGRGVEPGGMERERIAQGQVAAEQVRADQRRTLVGHLVRACIHGRLSISRCGILSSS